MVSQPFGIANVWDGVAAVPYGHILLSSKTTPMSWGFLCKGDLPRSPNHLALLTFGTAWQCIDRYDCLQNIRGDCLQL